MRPGTPRSALSGRDGWVGTMLPAMGAHAVRFAAWLGLSVVFATVITPLAIVYRLLRRRREAAWRPAHPPHGGDRYSRPW